jgi:hypothetical protein
MGIIKPVMGLVVLPTTVSASPKDERKRESKYGIRTHMKVMKKLALGLIRNVGPLLTSCSLF